MTDKGWGFRMRVVDLLKKALAVNATARAMLEKTAGAEAYAVVQVLEVQAELLESAAGEFAKTEGEK